MKRQPSYPPSSLMDKSSNSSNLVSSRISIKEGMLENNSDGLDVALGVGRLGWLPVCLVYDFIGDQNQMGGRSSGELNREYEQLLDEFQVLQENLNEGLRYLEHKETKDEYLLREVSCHDKEAFLKVEKVLLNKKEQLAGNSHVAPLIKTFTNSQDQFCMTYFKLFALFLFPQRTLEDEINQRGLQKRRFQEKELWSILASCIVGLSHLQKSNIKHACLRSSSILISTLGVIKVYDPIATGSPSNYDTLLNHRDTPHIYLSPEQVEALKEEKVQHDYDPFRSDIFTMGMVILEAGLLAYQDECYRDQYSRIHWETLQYNINLFQQAYSAQLTNLLEFMLGRDERARPDWFQLEQHVIKAEEEGDKSMQRPSQAKRPSQPQQKGFGMDKPLSSSHTPSEIGLSNRYQSSSRIGITRSKVDDRPVHLIPYNPVQSPLNPIRISDIQATRPFKSVFPSPMYAVRTSNDENILVLSEDQKDSDWQQPRFIPEAAFTNLSEHSSYKNGASFSPAQNESFPVYHHFSAGLPTSINSSYNTAGHSLKAPIIFHDLPAQPQAVFQTPHRDLEEFVIENYKQGSRYEGGKLNGLKHGFGKFFYQDGGRYEGFWREGRMEGSGKLYYQSDRLAYEGEWQNDQFAGRGTLYNEYPEPLATPFDYRNFDNIEEYWVRYEGQFSEDMKHGWGLLHLSNGEYFEGEFKNDYADGIGTFVMRNGKEVRGRWQSNIME